MPASRRSPDLPPTDSAPDGAAGGVAWVVHPEIRSGAPARSEVRGPAARLEEAAGLARAVASRVDAAEVLVVRQARAATLFGPGQLSALAERLDTAAAHPDVVIVNTVLSAIQQRNLERRWRVKVLDRTALILEIFGARARTREGRLQVELAALSYQRSRLVRSWTHLERQRGGLGFVGGPGESQLEVDRRRIDERIARLRRALTQVARTRGLHRAARRRVPFPVVALVGYTNAGKSTLFNRLTGAGVAAENRLFATLDPTMRALPLASGRTVVLSDTVGFVADLPTDLVTAFRATLEEVVEADLIVHVRDAAHPDGEAQNADVAKVLAGLGVDPEVENGAIEVHNKIDLLPSDARGALRTRVAGATHKVAVSALDGTGLALLRDRIDRCLAGRRETVDVALRAGEGAALAWLYRHGEVLSRDDGDDGTRLRVALEPADAARFSSRFPEARTDGPGPSGQLSRSTAKGENACVTGMTSSRLTLT